MALLLLITYHRFIHLHPHFTPTLLYFLILRLFTDSWLLTISPSCNYTTPLILRTAARSVSHHYSALPANTPTQAAIASPPAHEHIFQPDSSLHSLICPPAASPLPRDKPSITTTNVRSSSLLLLLLLILLSSFLLLNFNFVFFL